MNQNIMLDIETLSTQPNAAVIAIGLCSFNSMKIGESTQILIDPRFAIGHRCPKTIR